MENTIQFFNQWTKRPQRTPQEFKEPTCTVPNQSMTVAEIIAKFSRMGIIPAVQSTLEAGRYLQRLQPAWDGDNRATDPDFDLLDNGQDLLDEVAAQMEASQLDEVAAQKEASQLDDMAEQAPAGDGGDSEASSPA